MRKDKYTCPQGETLRPVARRQFKSKYSKREFSTYRTERGTCAACPLRDKCTTDEKLGRAIIRDGYEEYRQRMKEKLSTSEGRSIYGKRKCLVEPVFGQMKTRGGFSQFLLRGLRKARLEWKIAAIAHNLLTKADIRVLSRKLGLPTWNKSSMACLASRFPYHVPIERAHLVRVGEAEDALRSLGLAQLRVRHHGDIARIEVPAEEFPKLMAGPAMRRIVSRFKKLGYIYVTLDLEGYRTGSLNEPLGKAIRSGRSCSRSGF